jgi:hypothetical protein
MPAPLDPTTALVLGALALLLVVLLVALLQFLRGLSKLAARKEPLTPADALPSSRPAPRRTDLKLLVQLPLSDRFGSPTEQDSYARVAQALSRELTGDERGSFGGALIARGVEILTVVNVAPDDCASALVVVHRELERERLLDRAVILVKENGPDGAPPRFHVVWPAGYDGPFYDC